MLTIMDREDGSCPASLYDFSLVNAWSNHPIADSRPEEYVKLERIQQHPVEVDTVELFPASGTADSNSNAISVSTQR
jgi:hypothetical protein